MGIHIERHGRRRQAPSIQIAARIDPDLAKKVKLFAVTHEVAMAAVIEAGLKAVLDAGAKAVAD